MISPGWSAIDGMVKKEKLVRKLHEIVNCGYINIAQDVLSSRRHEFVVETCPIIVE